MGFETEFVSTLAVFGSKEAAEDRDILVMDIIFAHFVNEFFVKAVVCWVL